MAKAAPLYTVDDHFAGKSPLVRGVYDRLVGAVQKFGPVGEEPKKTSIHLTRNSAFAGVQIRKGHIVLTVKAEQELDSPRIHKSERVSASRFHHEIKLLKPGDVDRELLSWLRAAYALSD